MDRSQTLSRRPWAVAASLLGYVMTIVYVVLIFSEGNNRFTEILPWALLMGAAATLALVGSFVEKKIARHLLNGAAVLYALLGILAILTIGVGFLAAAVLTVVAIVNVSREPA